MTTITNIFVGLVILLHVYFLVLEMFLWDKPFGLRTFGLKQEFATASKSLAANQGLYNGFLAAGLVWGLSLGANGTNVKVFFLCCVLIAGLYGAVTSSHKIKILFIQAIPAALALALVFLS
jgi:putative membrane protein